MLISPRVLQKLEEKHNVSRDEVWQCFLNRTGGFLIDHRLEHQTAPATKWFISETDKGRKLKIVFVDAMTANGKEVAIKTAYEANADEIAIYDSLQTI